MGRERSGVRGCGYASWPKFAISTGAEVLPVSVPYRSMVLTTSMPLVTYPNTTCLPSSQGASTVVRKNCEPLVAGPRRHGQHAGRVWG